MALRPCNFLIIVCADSSTCCEVSDAFKALFTRVVSLSKGLNAETLAETAFLYAGVKELIAVMLFFANVD